MTEPIRLWDEHRDDAVFELLEAMRCEQPSARARRRTLRAVGVWAPLVAATLWAKTALAHGGPWLYSALGFVGASSVMAATILIAPQWSGWEEPPVASSASQSQTAPARADRMDRSDRKDRTDRSGLPAVAAPHLSTVGEGPHSGEPPGKVARDHALEQASLPASDVGSPARRSGTSLEAAPLVGASAPDAVMPGSAPDAVTPGSAPDAVTPGSAPDRVAPAGTLDGEIDALYQVRVELEAHRPAAALERLDGYAKTFSNPTLGTEAAVLRLRALLESGQGEVAESLGQRLLSANPEGPHAARIRDLLRGSQ